MPNRERKYTLDTNVFIESFRDSTKTEAIQRFHRVFGPFEFLSSVVIHELRAGAQDRKARRALERHIVGPFDRRGRVFTPTAVTWEKAGDVLAAVRREEGMDLKRARRSFGNDVLLAVSCREAGIILVTQNTRDFERIARYSQFTFIQPWPETK